MSKSREQIQDIRSRQHDATQLTDSQLVSLRPETQGPFSAVPSHRISGSGHEMGSEPRAAPGWTIRYGGEFWRRANQLAQTKPKDPKGSSAMMTSNIDLGDIIDRVSHAITKDDFSAVPRVQAKTYRAAFDEAGVRFSPHRPENRELIQSGVGAKTGSADFQSAVSRIFNPQPSELL